MNLIFQYFNWKTNIEIDEIKCILIVSCWMEEPITPCSIIEILDWRVHHQNIEIVFFPLNKYSGAFWVQTIFCYFWTQYWLFYAQSMIRLCFFGAQNSHKFAQYRTNEEWCLFSLLFVIFKCYSSFGCCCSSFFRCTAHFISLNFAHTKPMGHSAHI